MKSCLSFCFLTLSILSISNAFAGKDSPKDTVSTKKSAASAIQRAFRHHLDRRRVHENDDTTLESHGMDDGYSLEGYPETQFSLELEAPSEILEFMSSFPGPPGFWGDAFAENETALISNIRYLAQHAPAVLMARDKSNNTLALFAVGRIGFTDEVCLEIVEGLFRLDPSLLEQVDGAGNNLAHLAAENGRLGTLKRLAEITPQIMGAKTADFEYTPAVLAAIHRQWDTIRYLAQEFPESFLERDDDDETALDYLKSRANFIFLSEIEEILKNKLPREYGRSRSLPRIVEDSDDENGP